LQEESIDAAESGTIDKVLDLLGSGAEIDGKHAGWTALGRTSQKGHLDVAWTLIEYGASLDIRMDVGWGILLGCIRKHNSLAYRREGVFGLWHSRAYSQGPHKPFVSKFCMTPAS